MATDRSAAVADHHMRIDRVSSRPKKVLIVVANRPRRPPWGWPVGFWEAELTHPLLRAGLRGAAVAIASPSGGSIELDSLNEALAPLSIV